MFENRKSFEKYYDLRTMGGMDDWMDDHINVLDELKKVQTLVDYEHPGRMQIVVWSRVKSIQETLLSIGFTERK